MSSEVIKKQNFITEYVLTNKTTILQEEITATAWFTNYKSEAKAKGVEFYLSAVKFNDVCDFYGAITPGRQKRKDKRAKIIEARAITEEQAEYNKGLEEASPSDVLRDLNYRVGKIEASLIASDERALKIREFILNIKEFRDTVPLPTALSNALDIWR